MRKKFIAILLIATMLSGCFAMNISAMKVFIQIGDKNIEMEIPEAMIDEMERQNQTDQQVQLANEHKVQEQSKQDELNAMETKLKELENIVKKLTSENEDHSKSLSLLQNQASLNKSEIEDQKVILDMCRKRQKELEGKIKQLEATAKDQGQFMQDELVKKNAEIVNLKKQVEQQKQKDNYAYKIIEKLNSKITKFKVRTYIGSYPSHYTVRVDIPEIDDAKNYKIYISTCNNQNTESLDKDGSKKCVFESFWHESYVYFSDDNQKIEMKENTNYYFYLVINDNLQETIKTKVPVKSVCWTDEGNYDIDWYNKNTTDFNISTEKELAGLAYLMNKGIDDFEGKNIHLKNSLDMSDYEWEPKHYSDSKDKSKNFKGVFDGENYLIKGLYISQEHNSDAGLFGHNYGTIKNIGVVDGHITGYCSVGAIAAKNKGLIQNCFNASSVNGGSYETGGIVGENCGNI